ncbi:hypothetical protein ABPG74_013149 [Tetrahymena malaccensis]
MNYQFLQDNKCNQLDLQNKSEVQNPVLLSYVNSILRLILMIWLSDCIISDQKEINQIWLINLIISIAWSIAFYFTFYLNLFYVLFQWKWVKINNEFQLSDFVKSKYKNVKCISILISKRKWQRCKNQQFRNKLNDQTMEQDLLIFNQFDQPNENMKQTNEDDLQCIYYQFYFQISQYLKECVQINFEDRFNNTICGCHKIIKLMVEEPIVLNNTIQQESNCFKSLTPYIINERIQRGYLFTPFTSHLLQNTFTQKSDFKKKYIMLIKSQIFNIIIYTKLIKDSMIVNPQLILLDLQY